ncbi:MAG: Murein DD-endopeptidase MepM [Pseudomonadota bacterium]|jgi:murein DD-endopeptidase MepM/ murein hydrolase activator NlpD
MQLMFVRNARSRVQQISLSGKQLLALLLCIILLLMVLNVFAIWLLSVLGFETQSDMVIEVVEARYDQKLTELGTQMGELNQRIKRLDAARQQLIDDAPRPPPLPSAPQNLTPSPTPAPTAVPKSSGGQGGPMLGVQESLPVTGSFAIRMEQLTLTMRDLQAQTRVLTDRLQTMRVWQVTAPTGYPLPYVVPVSSLPGVRTDPFTGLPSWHAGTDYAAQAGMPILATGDGYVVRAEWGGDFGNVVEVSHPGANAITRYAHTEAFYVKPGQRVKRGEVIARVGTTGRSTAPHLHYEVQMTR